MASLPKKRKNETLNSICIRLCDSFKRTPQNLICPFIRAEESVRVFYRLKQEPLKNILSDAGIAVDLELISITWCPGEKENITMDGNIFIEYKSTELWDEDTFTKYKDFVTLKLEDINIKYILVDQVMEQSTLSQPVITEIDYKIYELDCKIQNYLCQYQNSAEPDTFPDDLENIMPLLQELKGRRIQIAVLSHNAIGKSFLLNLLLLLTAESNKKSGEETKKMPKDIIGNPTVKMVKEEQFKDLPEVIKDFLDEITDDEQDFKNLVKPICHQLHFTDHEELRRIESSFKSLSGYFTNQMRIDLEPYLLPQKDIFGDYNATTNCVFYLRYGTSFQAKVEYFDEKELQNQLFELVSLEKGSTERRPEFVNESMQEKAEQSLKARFKILTKHVPVNHDEETLEDVLRLISSPGEIELCEQLKEFVGKTELYIGNGKNPSADRFALQKLLKEFTLSANDEDDDDDEDNNSRIMKQKIASLKRLVVYVPSTLLYGGIEILEMPGTNDSDPLAMSFIQDALDEVEAVLLLSEFGFRLAGQEVRDCLTNSRFITHWKRDSNEYKLMFVSYPEKNHIYQICARDLERLEKIMMENSRKQEEEFQSLNDLLHPVQLTPAMKQNIFSSTLLPVLHSSILSLEGDPFDILENNKDFLKNSGIDLLLKEFHRIIIQKKKVTILEIEKRLEEFEASQTGEANDELENDTPPEDDTQPATQTIDFEQEREVLKTKENYFNKMKEEIEGLIKETVDGRLKEILERSSLNAVDKWAEIKNEIRGTAIFNPQYSGRHPTYKRKMDKVLFENVDKEISPVLKDLMEKLEHVVDDCKKKAVTSFKEDLQKKAETAMEDALTGFLGMTRTSFNENTLMKSFESLCIENMKKYLLEPVYRDTIENLKNKIEPCIHQVLNELQRSFSQETISLYKERWPANLAKVMVRIFIPLKSIQSSQPGCTFCGKIKCSLCNYIESTATFTSTNKNRVYPVIGSVTCTSKCVIYLITCKKCKKQYVGKTRREIRSRFADRLSTIRCNKKGVLNEHFNMDGHSEMSLVIIEEEKNHNSLSEKEKYWIRELGTLKPAGLNAQC